MMWWDGELIICHRGGALLIHCREDDHWQMSREIFAEQRTASPTYILYIANKKGSRLNAREDSLHTAVYILSSLYRAHPGIHVQIPRVLVVRKDRKLSRNKRPAGAIEQKLGFRLWICCTIGRAPCLPSQLVFFQCFSVLCVDLRASEDTWHITEGEFYLHLIIANHPIP